MKYFRLFACLSALMAATCAFSQKSGKDVVMEKFMVADSLMKIAEKPADYSAAYKAYTAVIKAYDRLSEAELSKFDRKSVGLGIYYNAACTAARTGRPKIALKYLRAACECGYNNASWAKTDTDLESLHGYKEFDEIVTAMSEHSYLSVLKAAAEYTDAPNDKVRFTYATPNDSNLVRTRRYFNLDSIAGSGDEISKIKNLLYFVHDAVRHDGSSKWPEKRDAISLYEVCKKENRGINCRMMAIMLNECYLAMGWKSRYVTCMPEDSLDNDCHVINVVYSNTLDKWIWVDPTFAAYVSDDKGNLLSIDEVRERLVNDKPLVLNDDANWNHEQKQTKEDYLENYMAKNLYFIECISDNRFGNESTHWADFILLVAKGHERNWRSDKRKSIVTTNNELFWKQPY